LDDYEINLMGRNEKNEIGVVIREAARWSQIADDRAKSSGVSFLRRHIKIIAEKTPLTATAQ